MPRVRGCATTATALPELREELKSQPDTEKEAEEVLEQTEKKGATEKEELPKREKKQKKAVSEATQADEDDEEVTFALPKKKKQKTEPRVKEAVANNTYWLGIAADSGVSVQDLKKVFASIRTIACRDLLDEKVGTFRLHGICTLTVKELKHREPYTRIVKEKKITVSEREPYKKIYAKSLLGIAGLSD